MTMPRRPITGGETHTQAIERLDVAVADQAHRSQDNDASHGTSRELTAAFDLAAANEQVAAREAWVKYIEHGY
jgi:hypothetical protein